MTREIIVKIMEWGHRHESLWSYKRDTSGNMRLVKSLHQPLIGTKQGC